MPRFLLSIIEICQAGDPIGLPADGLFLASGRRIPRTGGVILAKCDSRETLQARLSQDPFQQLGLARTEIIPFEASMASPALQSLL